MARDEEFVEFAETCSRRLLHAAYLITNDRYRAEDAVQTALTRAYASWSRVRRQDAFAYVRTTMVNHVIDGWRRPLRELVTSDVPERHHAPDVADAVTRRQWLIGAMAALSPRERTVIVLRYFFDLTEVEVAREMDVSVGTVKSTHSRALAKLRVNTHTAPTDDPATEPPERATIRSHRR